MAAAGFTVTINYGVFDWSAEEALVYADVLASYGMRTYWDLHGTNHSQALGDPDGIKSKVEAVKNHPATAGYYVNDENTKTPSETRWLSELIRTVDPDPNHELLVVHYYRFSDCMEAARPYVDVTDALGLDIYALKENLPAEDVARCSAEGQAFNDEHDKTWMVVLQAFNGADWGFPHNEFPSRERMRQERDLALASARPEVIFWWWYPDIVRYGKWEDVVWAANGDRPPAVKMPATLTPTVDK